MKRGSDFWTLVAVAVLALPSNRVDAEVVQQTHHLIDFIPKSVACGMDIDVSDMSVNLPASDCAAIKGVDPPGAAFLFDYTFEVCDSSGSGSSNVSIEICPVAAGPCYYVANTSTGVAETPGCTEISGPVSVAVDPNAMRVLLVHTDTDASASTRALAVRLYWLTGGPIFYNGFETGDLTQWSDVMP